MAGRAGEQQHRQDNQGRCDNGQQKCPEKSHSASDSAKSRENAENKIDDGFEHALVLAGRLLSHL